MKTQSVNDQRVSSNTCCVFCGMDEDDEFKYGRLYTYNDIRVHHFCLLFSSNLLQHGEDDEGILGFLYSDIQDELKRGSRLTCWYCKKKGATVGCFEKVCKKTYHFPCGLNNAALFRFSDVFGSYCVNHRKLQEKPKVSNSEHSNHCHICFDSIVPEVAYDTLYAPCCFNGQWYHRNCLQRLALSSGYFFKCPLCNNNKSFQKAMTLHGIYIPERDAAWETEPNAFEELLARHNRCDMPKCKCPQGRTFSKDGGRWEVILCDMCGSCGSHIFCTGQTVRDFKGWICTVCITTVNGQPTQKRKAFYSKFKMNYTRYRKKRPKKNCNSAYPKITKVDIMEILKCSKEFRVVVQRLTSEEIAAHRCSTDKSNQTSMVSEEPICVVPYQEFIDCCQNNAGDALMIVSDVEKPPEQIGVTFGNDSVWDFRHVDDYNPCEIENHDIMVSQKLNDLVPKSPCQIKHMNIHNITFQSPIETFIRNSTMFTPIIKQNFFKKSDRATSLSPLKSCNISRETQRLTQSFKKLDVPAVQNRKKATKRILCFEENNLAKLKHKSCIARKKLMRLPNNSEDSKKMIQLKISDLFI